MDEILVISGKGGTGKTSITACFAHLAGSAVLCDLDVDAPDLHLLLRPENIRTEDFVSGNKAEVRPESCDGCGLCATLCRFDAVRTVDDVAVVDAIACEGCKVCVTFCPQQAIDFPDSFCGRWFVSRTRFGTLVHAQLLPGEENSGRLVTLLRQQAKQLAQQQGSDLVISDGPPGIGCPVIAALGGVTFAVIVSEPTVSGMHDLKRVWDLCRHFRVPAGLLINKYDLHPPTAEAMARFAKENGITLLGRVPFDRAFVDAAIQARSITEQADHPLAAVLSSAWDTVWKTVRADDAIIETQEEKRKP